MVGGHVGKRTGRLIADGRGTPVDVPFTLGVAAPNFAPDVADRQGMAVEFQMSSKFLDPQLGKLQGPQAEGACCTKLGKLSGIRTGKEGQVPCAMIGGEEFGNLGGRKRGSVKIKLKRAGRFAAASDWFAHRACQGNRGMLKLGGYMVQHDF